MVDCLIRFYSQLAIEVWNKFQELLLSCQKTYLELHKFDVKPIEENHGLISS